MRDLDIRRELRRLMAQDHDGDKNTVVVEELGLCQGIARVDMAVINGRMHGYEIKSDQDTLTRLPGQVATYSRVLDFVTIIVSRSHEARVREMVPEWWGISVATQHETNVKLRHIRKPRLNRCSEPLAIVQLLWRDEALHILEVRGLAEGVRSKARGKVWERLVNCLDRDELATLVRETIKRRISDRPAPSRPA